MLSKIWRDPVWSGVISASIFGLLVYFITWGSKNNHDEIKEKRNLVGSITLVDSPNFCNNNKANKVREVKVTLLNTNIEPKLFNICEKFEFKNIEGKKGQKISYKAESGILHDDGTFFLWENKNNLIILR